ncbi:MAG TPA: hypothetical protein VFQ53_27950 [Kofleriaceae bacterium]|nr:hypothetical protein [Kofleriaceae bacterium]
MTALPLTACTAGERAATGECPAGEDCSDTTPNGLHFVGAGIGGTSIDLGSHPTAVGGTQTIHLEVEVAPAIFRPLDLPYTADDDGGLGVRVAATSGADVTLEGVATRENYLRILASDGGLMDRKLMDGAAITGLALVPGEPESPEPDFVLATGHQRLVVALTGEVQGSSGPYTTRVIDESMAIDLAGALAGSLRPAWDTIEIPNATVGPQSVTVTAGDRPAATLSFEVVAAADELVARAPEMPLAVGQLGSLCFSARNHGRYVAGLPWTITVDNGPGDNQLVRNCVLVQPEREGTLTATVTSDALTLQATYTVGPAPAHAPATTARRTATTRETAGERAQTLATF